MNKCMIDGSNPKINSGDSILCSAITCAQKDTILPAMQVCTGSLIASVTDKQYLTITLITVIHGSVPYTHVDVSNSGSAG